MKFLFFDVSSNGMPKNWKASVEDTFHWPRMVQIAWQVYEKLELAEERMAVIKPEGFEISAESSKFHRVTQERAMTEGEPIQEVLKEFAQKIKEANFIIAHNMAYNEKIVGAEFIRAKINHLLFNSDCYCLMQESTHFCKIPGKYGRLKWPNLNEINTLVFGEKIENINDAVVDVRAVSANFFMLLKHRKIDIF